MPGYQLTADVLALSGASFLQGSEWELDGLTTKQGSDTCGMAIVFPLVMEKHDKPTRGSEPVPGIDGQRFGFGALDSQDATAWKKVWSYRRIRSSTRGTTQIANGDLSMQNWNPGNDYLDKMDKILSGYPGTPRQMPRSTRFHSGSPDKIN